MKKIIAIAVLLMMLAVPAYAVQWKEGVQDLVGLPADGNVSYDLRVVYDCNTVFYWDDTVPGWEPFGFALGTTPMALLFGKAVQDVTNLPTTDAIGTIRVVLTQSRMYVYFSGGLWIPIEYFSTPQWMNLDVADTATIQTAKITTIEMDGGIQPVVWGASSASNNMIFVDQSTGKLCYKDSSGAVHDLY